MQNLDETQGDGQTFHCGACGKHINKKHRHLTCKICNNKIHIKCNDLGSKTFVKLNQNNYQIIPIS